MHPRADLLTHLLHAPGELGATGGAQPDLHQRSLEVLGGGHYVEELAERLSGDPLHACILREIGEDLREASQHLVPVELHDRDAEVVLRGEV